jgi:hypothetical protein
MPPPLSHNQRMIAETLLKLNKPQKDIAEQQNVQFLKSRK